MPGAVLIALKDLRQRVRDRSALVMGILVPFVLAAILAAALGSPGGNNLRFTYGVVDEDRADLSKAFQDTLSDLDFVKLVRFDSRQEVLKEAEAGAIAAAFVFPPGFSSSVGVGGGATLEVLENPESGIGSAVARSLAGSFAAELRAVQLSVATAVAGSGAIPDPGELAALAQQAMQVPRPVLLEQARVGGRSVRPSTFFASGMAVFFLFFTVAFGVRSLLEERQEGTLARLLAGPVPTWAIPVGKALATLVVGLVSMVVLVTASTVLLGARWGDPLGVGVLIVAGVVAAMSLTALVATFARTPEQAEGYSTAVSVVLGLFGGTFFPLSQGPDLMARLSLLTPHAWLMRGFRDLSARPVDVTAVLPSVWALLVFTVVTGTFTLLRARALIGRPGGRR
ncbi:MAG: ABC transporter permease [Actinomycetota bacterium]